MSSIVKSKGRITKPESSGLVGRWFPIVGAVAIAAWVLPTSPLAGGLAIVVLAFNMLGDNDKVQEPEQRKHLELLMHSKTARHPSIWESRKELTMTYGAAAVNQAIDYMMEHSDFAVFSPQSNHPLKVFGQELFVFFDPESNEIYMPIDGLKMILTERWQVDDSINVSAAELPSVDVPAIAPAVESVDWGAMALPGNRETLLNRLKSECPELLKLIKSPPIRLVGVQRSGKSSLAQRIALLRCIFLDGHSVAWCSPHSEADNRVPEPLNHVGVTASGAKDFSQIERVWEAIQGQIDAGKQINLTAVFDEFGSYDAFENADLLNVSLRSMLREASKHLFFPVIVLHGETSPFMPGSGSIVTVLKTSTVRVETHGIPVDDFGTVRPSGKATITWLDGTQSEFQTPEWLTVDYLLTLVKGDTKPDFLESPATVTPPKVEPQQPISERDRLELLFNSEPNQASEETVKPDLFDSFAATLNHESQADLKNFVLWLKKYKGQTINYEQIKGNWARNSGVSRSKETLMPLITIAKSNKLLSQSTDNNWLVSS